MRPTILPGLLDAVRLNFNHHQRNVKLFEIGKVFAARATEDPLPAEQELLTLVVTGGEVLENKANPIRELDFFDIKGAIEMALDAVGVTRAQFEARDIQHLRKGQSAAVSVNGSTIGFLGRLSDEIASAYKFKQPVYVAELNLQEALSAGTAPIVYEPLGRYPSVVRDVSLVTDRDLSFESIRHAIHEQGRELCRSVQFVDVFEGKGLADNERSVTIRLEYRSDERTLIESEVEEIHSALVRELEEKTGARQRF
jgi:phenylalanyl-tRNA synthetase beta chain